ncbi:GNAT family N-acetyltransferase [Companilactobacillus sp. HBUAS56275]|uniref:GNAT family N-acetyltransferase n=1 Tax=Candidatus Companilactobacillus pullicola TaxID=2838523 RepID=A0A9D2CPJ3_9LACO|nr:GNAT family N-acetyltransferase [Candidatus Companilactobacillus pullicola]
MLIEGKDIKIRDFQETDFPQFQALVGDRTNHELAGLEYSIDPSYVHELFEMYKRRDDSHVIAEVKNNTMVGIIEINHRGEYADLAATREIGFVVDQKYRRKGYATQAIQLVVDYGFNQEHLTEIWSSTEENNQVPQKVLEKLGFKYIYSADQALPFATQSNMVKYYLLKK